MARRFSEAACRSAKPDAWHGTEPIDGHHLCLFHRGAAGVMKWDTQTDTGTVIRYPHKNITTVRRPARRQRRRGLRIVWDYSRGLCEPAGIARQEVKSDRFTGFFSFPKDTVALAP